MAAVTTSPHGLSASWLQRIDEACERFGDRLNPILVKETRQALKSRQFVTTFSVLLFAALAWTIVGSLSMMPEIYTSPSAQRMLIGYYLVLALPMLLVVPLAAYRSLEGEIDDGTLELLSITTLSAWQIVLGKLASAMLQMVLYFVALFPCVAYAYTLRGVDLPTTLLMMGVLLVAATLLTIIALFFAPLAKTRTGRISTLLAAMGILIASQWGLTVMVISMILYGNPLSANQMFFAVTASMLISVTLGHLLLSATAAQLTPESENRSTRLRISLMVLSATILGLGAFAIQTLGQESVTIALGFAAALAGLWAICGSMMVAETPVITPRIRRELPSSFLARSCLTWFTPGPVTGLVFATVNVVVIAAFVVYGFQYLFARPGIFSPGGIGIVMQRMTIAFSAYLIGFFVAIRLVIGVIRINNNPRVELGIAGLVAIAVLASLVPYAIGLHINDYRPFTYSNWQITNWVWTLAQIMQGNPLDETIIIIICFVTIAFFACLLAAPNLPLPRRTATPKRVEQELEALKST